LIYAPAEKHFGTLRAHSLDSKHHNYAQKPFLPSHEWRQPRRPLVSMNVQNVDNCTIYGKDFSNGPANSSGTAGNNCMLAVERENFFALCLGLSQGYASFQGMNLPEKEFPLSCATSPLATRRTK